MPFQPPATLKSKLEQLREEGFVFRESDHAVANVSRWKHLKVAPQAAGTAAVIGDSHHRGKFTDALRGFSGRLLQHQFQQVGFPLFTDVLLQPL